MSVVIERARALLALRNKATPGPWSFEGGDATTCGALVGKHGWVCDFVDDPAVDDARLIS